MELRRILTIAVVIGPLALDYSVPTISNRATAHDTSNHDFSLAPGGKVIRDLLPIRPPTTPTESWKVGSPTSLACSPDPGDEEGFCPPVFGRAGAKERPQMSSSSVIDGVRGTIKVPVSLSNREPGRGSAADVYMITSGDGESDDTFAQAGWLWDEAVDSSAPWPRAFFGENNSSTLQTGDERLSAPVSVTPGSTYTFELRWVPSSRKFYGFVNGVQRWISTYTHPRADIPAINGEVNFACVQMKVEATNLQYHTDPIPTRGTLGVVIMATLFLVPVSKTG